MIILFSILSIENSTTEKKDSKFLDVPPSYSVNITGNTTTDCITITLSPSRFLVSGEKIKIYITDACGNPIHYQQFVPEPDFSASSTVTICRSDFNLVQGQSYFCYSYTNGEQDYIVEAYYDLNDGNPQGIKKVRI